MKSIVSAFKMPNSDKYQINLSMMYSVHTDGDLCVKLPGEGTIHIDFDYLKGFPKEQAIAIANAINLAYQSGANQQKRIIAKKLDLL